MAANPLRSTAVELRRAAGSQSLQRLQGATKGWTAKEMDALADENDDDDNGKSPLHMAAWKGCLANVQYLVEDMGCDVNVYSKAHWSYGKTALFFAATQSRIDVLEYLLWVAMVAVPHMPNVQENKVNVNVNANKAKVCIVNNKGQSVRSLAATHNMPPSIMDRIQCLEDDDDDDDKEEWWNFRASHSDGLEYGDLDPRFLSRPLQSSDVVTAYAINPTTKATRKGGFARRNPKVAQEKLRQRQLRLAQPPPPPSERHKLTKKQTIKKAAEHRLSAEEKDELKLAWECVEMEDTSDDSMDAVSQNTLSDSLLTIVRLADQQRQPWIPEMVERLQHRYQTPFQCTLLVSIVRGAKDRASHNVRLVHLLDKLLPRLHGEASQEQCVPSSSTTNIASRSASHIGSREDSSLRILQSDLGQLACRTVQGLSFRQLEPNRDDDLSSLLILQLPISPIFIDALEQVEALSRILHEELERHDATVVAIDTEWYDVEEDSAQTSQQSSKKAAAVATIQISFVQTRTTTEHDHIIPSAHSYVLDLMPSCSSGDYHSATQELVTWMLECRQVFVLGFAIGHDVPLLEQFVGRSMETTMVLDLQYLMVQSSKDGERRKKHSRSLPGLKACAAQYSSITLSKEPQCSDWGRRPLTQVQLDYAGLDAAVLLFLLAAYAATTTTTNITTTTPMASVPIGDNNGTSNVTS